MRRLLIAAFVLVALLAACKKKPSVPPDVVARVGERMLTLADFRRYLDRNTGTDLAQMNPEVASALLDQYVEEVILSEDAARSGIQVPAETIASAVRSDAGSTVVEKRDDMRRQKLLASLMTQIPAPSDDRIRGYYETHQAEFRSEEEVRVRQILVRDEKLARDILARARKGEAFEALSSEHSLAANAKKGGDIGYISRGELPKMFEDVIFALAPGSLSEVIRTDSTFHIFRVDDRRPAGQMDVETAAPLIRQRLREDDLRSRVQDRIAAARGSLGVTVFTRRLPFKYTGGLATSETE